VISSKDVIEADLRSRGEAPGRSPEPGEIVEARESSKPGKSSKHIPEGGWLNDNDNRVTSLISIPGPGVERRDELNLGTVSKLLRLRSGRDKSKTNKQEMISHDVFVFLASW